MVARSTDGPGGGGSWDQDDPRPLGTLLAHLAQTLASTIPLHSLGICLVDPDGKRLSCHTLYADTDHETVTGPQRVPLAGSTLGEVLGSGRGMVLDVPLPADVARMSCARQARSLMVVPLSSGGHTPAVLVVGTRRRGAYDQAHLDAASRLGTGLARELLDVISSVV